MMTPEQRSELIEGLNGLADADDPSALATARKISGIVASLDSSWDELLIPAELDEDEDEDEDEALFAAEQSPDEQPVPSEDGRKALKLIESLMSRRSLYEGTREELRGYKEDIAAGEFLADDLHYLKALSRRLQKSSQS